MLPDSESTMKIAGFVEPEAAAWGSMSMFTDPLFVLTERRSDSAYFPLMDPEMVCKYVWREEKSTASRVPVVVEMDVVPLTVKFAPGWICIPMCVVATLKFDSEAPGAM